MAFESPMSLQSGKKKFPKVTQGNLRQPNVPPLPPSPAEPPRRTPRAESLLKLELCTESLLKLCVETLLKLWRVC